jgi:isoleucyl-tRNA synthetase
MGRELVGLRYEPLYNPREFGVAVRRMGHDADGVVTSLAYPVIATDFVSMEDGTGIVHMAPAFGEVDYEAGMAEGLNFVQNVDLQGNIIGNYTFTGKFAKDADSEIITELKSRGLLFRAEKIHHTYPFCWRCDTPLLYYAKETWYIRTTAVKDRMLAGNEAINWYPEHIKNGRFGDWLANNVDWAFSRERYWGTPLPIWKCPYCGELDCIGSLEELAEKPGFSGFREPLDLHRPFVDELYYECPKCLARMKRVTEVIDCWFDSGAMPIAQWHYPFNPDSKTICSDGRFPADYISEAVDQTRGWFYSLHALATLLFDSPSYKNVICLGLILDEKGEKMSKAKGNVVQPGEVIDKYGADAIRWYFFTAAPPGNARRFSENLVAEVSRRFLRTLWNVYSFFVTYANIDGFTPSEEENSREKPELDRWILAEVNALVRDVDKGLENYKPTMAGRLIEDFVSYLSNWYVRRSRRRFWKSESDADKLDAYNTLYHCLVTLCKLMAPFTPFIAEIIYQNLVVTADSGAPDSVHMADFPVADETAIDEDLIADTRLAMKVSSLGRAARSSAGIKVRQPLSEVQVSLTSAKEGTGLKRLKQQVLEELNVKEMVVTESNTQLEKPNYALATEGGYTVAVATVISAELAAEGMTREIVHRLQMMRRQAGFDIADHITTYYDGDEYIKRVLDDPDGYIKRETLSTELVNGMPEKGITSQKFNISGHRVILGVVRLP